MAHERLQEYIDYCWTRDVKADVRRILEILAEEQENRECSTASG